MKRKHHTPEQIIHKLRTAEQLPNQAQSFADVCRALEVSNPTYHRWQQLYGGMKTTEAKRLKGKAWFSLGDHINAIHPIQVSQWKQQLLNGASDLFTRGKKSKEREEGQPGKTNCSNSSDGTLYIGPHTNTTT